MRRNGKKAGGPRAARPKFALGAAFWGGRRMPAALLAGCILAGCLLTGCAGQNLALLPEAPPAQSAPAPAPAEEAADEKLTITCETLPAGFEALLDAYAQSQGTGVRILGPDGESVQPDLVLHSRGPDGQGYYDLSQDPLFTVLIQSAAALPGRELSGPCPELPLGFAGYGYLADGELLCALLGEEFGPESLQKASSAEWTGFIQALGGWIEAPAAQPVTLAGKEFTLPAEKPPAAQNLTGVFAVPAAEPDAFAGSALSPVFCAAFADVNGVTADETLLTGPLNSFWSAMRLETGWMAGQGGPLLRGQDGAAALTMRDAAALLAGGQAVFCRASTAGLLPYLSQEDAARMVLIPLKLPFDDTDLAQNAAFTLEQLASWPVVGTAGWLAIPDSASEEGRQRAESFLLWLFASKDGQRALVDTMGLLSIVGVEGGSEAASPALQTAADALSAGEALPDLADGFGSEAQQRVSDLLRENWLGQASWNPYQRPEYVAAVLAALAGG